MLECFPEGEGWVCEGDCILVVDRPNPPPQQRRVHIRSASTWHTSWKKQKKQLNHEDTKFKKKNLCAACPRILRAFLVNHFYPMQAAWRGYFYFVIRVPIFSATASVARSSGPMMTCGFAARDARRN